MVESIPFLTSGMVFGLAAGISPGPLLTLARFSHQVLVAGHNLWSSQTLGSIRAL